MARSVATPYDLLGVKSTANEFELRVAYRLQTHDLKQKKISAEEFQRKCRAFEALGHRTTRQKYDDSQEWISSIPLSDYSIQQSAAEPDLFDQLKKQLKNATLKQIDAQNAAGQTSLYCAARTCNVAAVIYLIEQGANPDLAQKFGSTALHVCSFYGHPEIVRCILESGANYLKKNSFGDGNLPETEISGDDTDTKSVYAELKQHPYVQAAANQLDWLKTSLENHIDEQYFRLRQTLLHCACKKGYFDLVKWLVETRHANIDIVDINLNSALHLASYGGHLEIVQYLIEKEANALLINKWGMTAEQEGLIHGTTITDVFRRVRQRNMFDMASQGKYWWFKYHFGANSPNTINNDGINILYVACRNGQLKIARWLLDNGAKVNVKLGDKSGSTPLHGAAFGGHLTVVELLLEHGADVNIKNNYGETAFENAQNDQLKKLLAKYLQNAAGDKFVSVHLYGDGKSSGDLPLAKVDLHYKATRQDLINALPDPIKQKYNHFSMARRPLIFDKDDTTVLSAVCGARYGKTIFVEMPLCITGHESARYMHCGHVVSNATAFLSTRDFQQKFISQCKSQTMEVKGQSDQIQTFQFDNLLFEFAVNCAKNDLTISVDYIFSPDFSTYHVPGCVCLFQTRHASNKLDELTILPAVKIVNDSNVYLYNWIQSSAYWFASSTKHTRLPLLGVKHALIRHAEVIPNQLRLLPDMFIQAAVGQPFTERLTPFVCRCLKIRDHDTKTFVHKAYHGTSIRVIPSILMDGFVMPSTVVSSGIRVCPPPNHIARQKEVFGVPDFSNGIFLSPSIHYCSDPAYAITFSDDDEVSIAILECAVKDKSFKSFPCTVSDYKPHSTDDVKKIEWRFTNPADIEILSVLFIPVIKSRLTEAKLRAKKLSVNPNDIK